jgi:hypothetical protein
MRYTDPAALPPIHTSWCSCRDCRAAADQRIRDDLKAIIAGMIIALFVAAVLIAIGAPGAGA